MFGKRGKHLISVMMTLLCAAFLGMPVFAGIPSTVDGSGMLLPIMGGLLVVSIILIVVYVILSKKKKR